MAAFIIDVPKASYSEFDPLETFKELYRLELSIYDLYLRLCNIEITKNKYSKEYLNILGELNKTLLEERRLLKIFENNPASIPELLENCDNLTEQSVKRRIKQLLTKLLADIFFLDFGANRSNSDFIIKVETTTNLNTLTNYFILESIAEDERQIAIETKKHGSRQQIRKNRNDKLFRLYTVVFKAPGTEQVLFGEVAEMNDKIFYTSFEKGTSLGIENIQEIIDNICGKILVELINQITSGPIETGFLIFSIMAIRTLMSPAYYEDIKTYILAELQDTLCYDHIDKLLSDSSKPEGMKKPYSYYKSPEYDSTT